LSGAFAVPNSGGGVVLNNVGGTVIGGSTPGAANVVSGNAQDGILISGARSGSATLPNQVQVQGNLIGTDVTGNFALPNAGNGVQIAAGANGNTIGGDSSDASNVISGNAKDGVLLTGTGTKGNQILGNFIGTDPSGVFSVANGVSGVEVGGGTSGNTIGGATAGAGNVISGNTTDGVLITGTGPTNNRGRGNFMGTDGTGSFAVANGTNGVEIAGGAIANTVGGVAAGNVISGNANDGVFFAGSGTTNNQLVGNFIGTDVAGSFAVPNLFDGVGTDRLASSNTIGGATAGACNVISGDGANGVLLTGVGYTVLGNFIGTDVTGGLAVPNSKDGLLLTGAKDSIVGGTAAGARNVISGNAKTGVVVTFFHPANTSQFDNSINSQIVGNFIGTDVTGAVSVGNGGNGVTIGAITTTLGGTAAGARNLISGNAGNGVALISDA